MTHINYPEEMAAGLMVLSFRIKKVHHKQPLVLEKGHLKGTKQLRECPVSKLHILLEGIMKHRQAWIK